MEESTGQDIERGVARAGGNQSSPIRLTKRRVILLVLLLWFVIDWLPFIFSPSHSWVGARGLSPDDKFWKFYEATGRIARPLKLFDSRAALIASLLLYFPFVVRGSPRKRCERRGEIFTGILNIHILVIALGLALPVHEWANVSASILGGYLLYFVLITATWILVGFHLCEGRLFTPAVGFLVGSLARYGLLVLSWRLEWGDFYGSWLFVAGQLVEFGWQLWMLTRHRDGFDLFPTGLWRALSRCARTFLPIAFCFWILDGKCFEFFRGEKDLRLLEFLGSSVFPFGGSVDPIVAYVVPLVFLLWPKDEFDRKSRGLTLVLFGVCMAVGVILYPIFGANQIDMLLSAEPVEPIASLTALAELPESFFVLLGLLFSPAWGVLVFLALLRWWVRGRYGVPLLVPVLGYAVFLVGMVVPWGWGEVGEELSLLLADRFVWSRVAGQLVTIVLSFVLLFKSPPGGEGAG